MGGEYMEQDRELEQGLVKDLIQREKQEEILWRKKSRKLWLKEGDQNTSFFHKSTVQHRQKNRINHLKTPTGQVVEKQIDIEQ